MTHPYFESTVNQSTTTERHSCLALCCQLSARVLAYLSPCCKMLWLFVIESSEYVSVIIFVCRTIFASRQASRQKSNKSRGVDFNTRNYFSQCCKLQKIGFRKDRWNQLAKKTFIRSRLTKLMVSKSRNNFYVSIWSVSQILHGKFSWKNYKTWLKFHQSVVDSCSKTVRSAVYL